MNRSIVVLSSMVLLQLCIEDYSFGDITKGHNIAFSAVNQNPWVPGEVWEFGENKNAFDLPINVNLPSLNGNPVGLALNVIEDFLGVDLPIDFSFGVGGTANGLAGLDYGYYVTGGRLNINYPARSSLNISTYFDPVIGQDIGAVVANRTSTIQTSFLPGVTRIDPNGGAATLAALAGNGYQQEMPLGNGGTFSFQSFETPNFATTSPYAQAHVEAYYHARVGAYAEAKACVVVCFLDARTDFTFGTPEPQRVPIVEVDPSGIYIAGAGEPIQIFGEPISFGGGSLELNFPRLAVGGNPTAPGSTVLYGEDSKPIATLLFSLESYIPLIGQFLQGSLGPFDYTLMSLDAGPELSLYQEFTFTPQPKVQLNFSEDVMIRGQPCGETLCAGGDTYLPARSVLAPLGESIDWRPVFGPNEEIRIQPTYILDNQFKNETGIGLGIHYDLEAISVSTPVGDFGPLFHPEDTIPLLQVPFYEQQFRVSLSNVAASEIVVPKKNFVPSETTTDVTNLELTSSAVLFRDELLGTARYRLEGLAHIGGNVSPFFTEVEGFETSYIPPGTTESVFFLTTDHDVIVYTEGPYVNLGRDFRLGVDDTINTQWRDPVDPVYLDALTGDELVLTKLFDFPSGIIDTATHPVLGERNFVGTDQENTVEQGPTIVTDSRQGPLSQSFARSHEGTPEGGGRFDAFDPPTINEAGQIAYRAQLTNTSGNPGDQQGLYRTGDDGTVNTLRGGEPVSDGEGQIWLFDNPASVQVAVSDSGRIVSRNTATYVDNGLSTSETGIYTSDESGVHVVARTGAPAPDTDADFATIDQLSVNRGGQAAFTAEAHSPDFAVAYTGLFRGNGLTTDVIARSDTTPTGLDHTLETFSDPSINDFGKVAFLAHHNDGTTFGVNGIYLGDSQSVTTVAEARIHSPQPGDFSEIYRPDLNNLGQVAFRAYAHSTVETEGGEGVYRGDGIETIAIARQAEPAPGTPGVFEQFLDPQINERGQVTFMAVAQSGGFYSGIFVGNGAELTSVAVSGQSPDNADGEFDFVSFVSGAPDFGFALNNHGHIAFSAALQLDEGGSVNGLYLHDGTYVVEIARTGQAYQGSTIQGIYLATGSDAADGLNDAMQVAYTVALEDGRQSVARFEPVMLWKNSGSGDWDTDGNWSLGVQPTRPYDVAIIREDPMSVAGPTTDRTVRSLILGGYGDNVNSLHLSAGGNLAATEHASLADNAELVVGAGHTLITPVVNNAGVIRGSGTIQGDVLNEGVVAPGNSTGALAIDGYYLQGAAGVFAVEIDDFNHDQLAVAFDATLGGTIAVSLLSAFSPNLGQSFTILNTLAGSVSGTFSAKAFPTFDGLTFDVLYGQHSVMLQVVVAGVAGDYNEDGIVDAADYTVWRDRLGSGTSLPNDDTPGVGSDDYDRWLNHFGDTIAGGAASNAGFAERNSLWVPEPGALVSISLAVTFAIARVRQRRSCC